MVPVYQNTLILDSSNEDSRNQSAPPQQMRTNVKMLMTQSTIYRRHQSRLFKTMEKADDPRPKVVRVLAGLPGFRTFVPPYQPPELLETHKSSISPGSLPPALSFAADESVIQLQTEAANTSAIANPLQSDAFVLPEQPLYALFAAAAMGAVAEACYGSTATKTSSPFRSANLATSSVDSTPLLQEHGSLSLYKLRSAFSPAFVPSSSPYASLPATKTQILAGASTASALFGTKALAMRYLATTTSISDNNIQEATSKGGNSNIMSPAFLTSSALAGAVAAAVSVIQLGENQFLWRPTTASHPVLQQTSAISKLLQQHLLTRHVVGATLYFSSYEIIKSCLTTPSLSTTSTEETKATTTTTKTPTILAIALSGATAGALYQSVLIYNTTTAFSPSFDSQMMIASPGRVRVVPAILRAAPAHALLFLAYEWAKKQE